MRTKKQTDLPLSDRELDAVLVKAQGPQLSASYLQKFPKSIVNHLLSKNKSQISAKSLGKPHAIRVNLNRVGTQKGR
jgi:hypothetical protein